MPRRTPNPDDCVRKRDQRRERRGYTRPRNIDVWERDHKCVQMRRAEIDWETIVAELGYSSAGHAHDRFVAFMRRYPRDDVEHMRDLELQRIEKTAREMEQLLTQGQMRPHEAIRAAEVWNKLSERRSKLMGMDKPERKEVTVITEDVVDKAIREAREAMDKKAQEARDVGIEVPTFE